MHINRTASSWPTAAFPAFPFLEQRAFSLLNSFSSRVRQKVGLLQIPTIFCFNFNFLYVLAGNFMKLECMRFFKFALIISLSTFYFVNSQRTITCGRAGKTIEFFVYR
jgi:hypothetical protein